MERACSRQGRRGAGLEEAQPNRASRGERPHERNRREGSPDPIPNSEVKPLLAESTAEQVRGRIGRSAHGRRFFFRAGGRGPGTRAAAPFCARARVRLLGGACAVCGSHCGQSIALHAAIRRVCCAATASLLICEKAARFSSSIISFSIIEFLCFTMLFVRSFTFTCISTGTI